MKLPKETAVETAVETLEAANSQNMTEEKKVEITVSFKKGGVFKSTVGKKQDGIVVSNLNGEEVKVTVDLEKISLKGQAIVICDTNGIAHIIYVKEDLKDSKKKYIGNNEEDTLLIYKNKKIMYFMSKNKAKPRDIYNILKKRGLNDFSKKLFVKSGEQGSYRFNTQSWYDWKE